jgi:hypothetical protein
MSSAGRRLPNCKYEKAWKCSLSLERCIEVSPRRANYNIEYWTGINCCYKEPPDNKHHHSRSKKCEQHNKVER